METEKIILQLANQVEIIKAHINRLKKPGYSIHELDIELLRNKTYEFYDLVNSLSNVKPETGSDYNPNSKPEQKIEDVISEQNKDTETSVITPTETEEKEPAISIEGPIISKYEEKTIIEADSKELNKDEEEPAPILASNIEFQQTKTDTKNDDNESLMEKPSSIQTTYDLFSETAENPVAEKLKANEEESIADKMQKSKISNIREAIGINDKFLFINQLFSGDLEKYNMILDEFNDLSTKQGVDTYLREIKIQYRWNQESDAYIRFKEIVDRKFS